MTVRNYPDRFSLVIDTLDRLPTIPSEGTDLKARLRTKLLEHRQYIEQHGEDLPEIRDWIWPHAKLSATN